ncbi:hypothetical protein ACQKIC_16175 [Peribacillus sp. NPDC046944]|uniref:hypothetical protein n=1 Tax=unclassified Peribacillus TaxID=2675266 RepID=UPI0038026159
MEMHELPNRRFYYSILSMSFEMNQNIRGRALYSGLYTCIYSYYEESLALLRATIKLYSTITEQEQNYEDSYSDSSSRIYTSFESEEDEETAESYRVAAFRLLEHKKVYYDDLELEKNLFSLGTIVQFLSLFESTLHSLYKKLIEIDTHLPKVEVVCKRDKGIVKYLKYFEKTLITNSIPVLVGTSDFQKIHHWIDFRNNIVHNNNESTEKLIGVINQRNLNITSYRDKLIFNESNIRDLADICGITLDSLIEGVFRPFFIQTGAIVV